MKFIADLHVHSKYSRATSKNMDLEHLYIAAQRKGIAVVGTGDCIHPQWFTEITGKLMEAEPGLFRLKDEIAKPLDRQIPSSCRSPVRFILQTEISNIYKKDDITRKNHNLIFLPDFSATKKLIKQLDKIGNIHSDGRPILGLDAKVLLEIVLHISDRAHLVPAHIWTPWFSMLGSKSGFDSLYSCFEELSDKIFAVETGLSSDPEMNRRLSQLDHLTLISNSDAHSPMKLGREANILNTDLSYDAIFDAIRQKNPNTFLGTIEFFPEEGKYHLDGHRKCGICLEPKKTKQFHNICPVCEKPLTLGVMHRVEELSDREPRDIPDTDTPFYHLIPLEEILSEIFNVGKQSKAVQMRYDRLLEKLGPEISILNQMELPEIASRSVPLLADAIARMRARRIQRTPGFDGEYGKIKVFLESEKQKLAGQKQIFEVLDPPNHTKPQHGRNQESPKKPPVRKKKRAEESRKKFKKNQDPPAFQLNPDQQKAVAHPGGHMMIIAGPGTGKTRTITERMLHIIHSREAAADMIAAITFTTKASEEMKARIFHRLPDPQKKPMIATFHAFCLHHLARENAIQIISEEQQEYFVRQAIQITGPETDIQPKRIVEKIQLAKQQFERPDVQKNNRTISSKDIPFQKIYAAYQEMLQMQNLYDFEDLIFYFVMALENDTPLGQTVKQTYRFVFVDEYQDINYGQYRMICALLDETPTPSRLCAIGDPDQSIYGFRGSDRHLFQRFIEAYPSTEVVRLRRNYRSTRQILQGAHQMLKAGDEKRTTPPLVAARDGEFPIGFLQTGSEAGEALAVSEIIHREIGGTGHHEIDTGDIDTQRPLGNYTYSDFAVLYRTSAQSFVFQQIFREKGIPYQVVSRSSIMRHSTIQKIICCMRMMSGSWTFPDLQRFSKIKKPSVSTETIDRFFQWTLQKKFRIIDAVLNAKKFPIPGVKRDQQSQLLALFEKADEMKKEYLDWSIPDLVFALAARGEKQNRKTGDQERDAAVAQLQNFSTKYQRNLRWFLEEVSMMQDTDMYLQKSEQVSLMTLHAAKGLEFPFVFVAGCEAGLLPFQRENHDISDPEEERRLFYVAMTRAKERLILSSSRKRRRSGVSRKQFPSPFLQDIGSEHLFEIEPATKKRKSRQRQLELF